MKETILSIVGLIICILAITWFIQGNSFFMYKVFAPKMEEVRRETFEQTKSYRDGMKTELYKMQYEYVQADDNKKAALKSIILHRVNSIDEHDLPNDLQQFINSLRKGY